MLGAFIEVNEQYHYCIEAIEEKSGDMIGADVTFKPIYDVITHFMTSSASKERVFRSTVRQQ